MNEAILPAHPVIFVISEFAPRCCRTFSDWQVALCACGRYDQRGIRVFVRTCALMAEPIAMRACDLMREQLTHTTECSDLSAAALRYLDAARGLLPEVRS